MTGGKLGRYLGSALENFARKIMEQADVFPPPPLPPTATITPLTSAPAMIAFGLEMKNCAGSKIGEVLLGQSYVYRAEHRAEDGTLTVLAVELVPLNNRQWMVKDIKGVKNCRPAPSVLQIILTHLHALGAVSTGGARTARARELGHLLGVYRWDAFDLDLLETHDLEVALETREAA